MPDTPQTELDAIAAERAKIFTPQWFTHLVSGRLAPGDTFWLGNYGILLWVVPALVLLTFVLAKAVPEQMVGVLGALIGVFGIYRVAVLRALIASTVTTPGPKGWRWVGVTWSALEATALLTLAWMSLAA